MRKLNFKFICVKWPTCLFTGSEYSLTQLFFLFFRKIHWRKQYKISSSLLETNIDDLTSKLDERKDKIKSPLLRDIDIDNLPTDPGEKKIHNLLSCNQRDEVKRKYLTKRSYQSYGNKFKQYRYEFKKAIQSRLVWSVW